MEHDQLEKIIFEIANLRRQLSNMVRPATVHEVKGDKMRMVIGRDKNGKDVLGPWLHTSNAMFGGARERRFFKKGQTLSLLCANGDISQAVVLPGGPNKKYEAPDHANETGQDEETYMQGYLRSTKTADGQVVFLQKPEEKQDQQEDTDDHKNETPKKRERKAPKPDSLYQLTKDGGFTARIGKDMRVAANKTGAKIKAGNNVFVTVTKDKLVIKCDKDVFIHASGTPWVNKPFEQADGPSDPVADDNKVLNEDESQSA